MVVELMHRDRSTAGRLAFVASLLCSLAAGAAPRSHLVVSYREGRLTTHAQATPAHEVFSAIARETGVRFVVDSEISSVPITIDVDGMELERGIQKVVAAVRPAVALFDRDAKGGARLGQVALFGAGKAPERAKVAVYGADLAPIAPASVPAPDPMQSMIGAGVPGQTAEKLIELDARMHDLQSAPVPGSNRPEDLSATSREYIPMLVASGMSPERAIQVLLMADLHRETVNEMWEAGGGRPGKFASEFEMPADDPSYP